MDGLTEGRMVHYVLPSGLSKGQHRPAVVVKVWGGGVVNLTVSPDWMNDGFPDGPYWATSVPFSEEPEPGTWH